MGYCYQNSIGIFVRISVRNPSYYYYLLFSFVVCLILNNLRNRIMEKINLALVYGGADEKKDNDKPYAIIYIDGVPYKIYLNGHIEPIYDK